MFAASWHLAFVWICFALCWGWIGLIDMDDVIGVEYIKDNEGLELYPYKCTKGKLTIGYGHNLGDRGITKEEAEFIFINDIQVAIKDLYRVFPEEVLDSLNSVRNIVLLDMMFNLGYHRFCGFKKMIQAINDHWYDKAADEILDSKYARTDVPERAARNAEMMRKGR